MDGKVSLLRKVKITRFKSIHDESISFGSVNLFIGGNGAGKSNVLEAIGVLSAALERGVNEADLSRKGLRLSTPAMFKSAFKNESLPRTLQMAAEFDHRCTYGFELTARDADTTLRFHTEKARLANRTLFGRSGKGTTAMSRSIARPLNEQRSVWDQTRAAFDVPPQMTNEFDALSQYAIYSPQTAFLRGEQVGVVQTPPIGLHGEGLPQAVAAAITQPGYHDKRTRDLYREVLSLMWLPGWAETASVGPSRPQIVPSKSPSEKS